MNIKKAAWVVVALAVIVGGFTWIGMDTNRINQEKIAEMLQIEKDLQNGIRPDQETIDVLYRWRNSIDSKYSFEGPSSEFIEVYDRVIKPL